MGNTGSDFLGQSFFELSLNLNMCGVDLTSFKCLKCSVNIRFKL